MKVLKGVTEKRFKKKKALTLLELIISICIINIVISAMIGVYLVIIKDYKKHTKESVNSFYVMEAFRFLENEISEGNEEINISNNIIKLKKWNNSKAPIVEEDSIQLNGQNLMIYYKQNGTLQTANNIIKNIEDFRVQEEGKLIIITVKIINDKEYKKCVVLS